MKLDPRPKPHDFESLGFQNATPLANISGGGSVFDSFTEIVSGLKGPNEITALTVSSIYACVNLLSGTIAALPMEIYARNREGDRDRLPMDAMWWILNEEMTPRWSAAAGWEFLGLSLFLHGDGFAKIKRRGVGGEIIGLEPVHPMRVTVIPYADGSRLVYSIEADWTIPQPSNGIREVLDQDDVLHIPGFGFNGVRGLSPLRHHLRNSGAEALAMRDYSAQFFANSARPDYAITTPGNPSAEQIEKLRTQLDSAHRGAGNNHKPMVLTGGMEMKAISMPIEEMQLLQTRQFSIEEIARIYGVPPFMIGHNEKTTSWGSGIEAMGTGFVRYTLRQHLNKIENEINRKLFRTYAKCASFDTAELERADFKTMMEGLRIGIGHAGEPGFVTPNEARTRLHLKPIDGSDILTKGLPDATNQAIQPAG